LAYQITAHNAGWLSQFRFAGSVSWSGVCEFVTRRSHRYSNMNTNTHPSLSPLLCALLTISATAQNQSIGQDTENGQIIVLIDKYAESVSQADTKLASEIWSTNDEVSFIHPGGHEHGWEQVRTNVYERLMGATFSERKLTVRDVVVRVHGDTAWAEFYWDFTAKQKIDGAPLKTRGRETQIYRKTDRGWRIVHVHYSGMPVRGERQGS
jgi:ketosteroid isomerase-like protein